MEMMTARGGSPTDDQLPRLTTAQVDSLVAEIVGSTPKVARQRSRRPLLVTMAVVAATTVTLLLTQLIPPAGGPVGPPAAVALERLATSASAESWAPLAPGQYRYIDIRQVSFGKYVMRQQSWTSSTGKVWRRDSEDGQVRYYTLHAIKGDLNWPSPQLLNGLPTDPDQLGIYLRSHVHGSSSTDEAVFIAVGDMLQTGIAPPALRAAALRVLETTEHITATDTKDSAGRPAIKVSFVDQTIRPHEVQSLYFDPDTAMVLEREDRIPNLGWTRTFSRPVTVDAVPAQVVRGAIAQKHNLLPPIGIERSKPGVKDTASAASTAPRK